MPIPVIFTGKALDMVCTGHDGTLFWPFGLVGKQVGLQVLDDSFTVGFRTSRQLFDGMTLFTVVQGSLLLQVG